MYIQTIVSDLDDTLLLEDHTIGEYTVSVLKKAQEKGIQVMLASGRAPKSMEKYVQQLNLQLPYIANNGATVVDPKTDEILYNLQFTAHQVRACLQLAKQNGIYAQTYYNDHFYYSTDQTDFQQGYEESTGLEGIYVDQIEAIWEHPSSKVLFILDPQRVPELYDKGVKELGDWVHFTVSKPYFLELSPKEANKGYGLKWLEEKGILNRESTMAFGDSLNDISMLSWAGYPVAMGNARQEAKEIAKYVTASNQEQGVGRAVEQLVIKGDNKIG